MRLIDIVEKRDGGEEYNVATMMLGFDKELNLQKALRVLRQREEVCRGGGGVEWRVR